MSAETGWQKLDRRTITAAAVLALGVAVAAGVPTAIGVASGEGIGVALAWVLPSAALLVAAAVVAETLRWRATSYRVAEERLELRFEFVVRSRKTLRLHRVRSVDVTANPLYRIFGLAELTAGTGQGGGTEDRIRLAPLRRAEADRLRTDLLRRSGAATGEDPGHDRAPLATLDWGWARYAPVSYLTPALGAASIGAALQVAEWFGAQQALIDRVLGWFSGTPLVVSILLFAAAGMLVGVVGSLGLFAEMWGNYRLEREPGGTLRVRRGLLTTRSVSVEERRLRGVELVEPLGTRLAGAARVDAVAVGMRGRESNEKTDYRTLLPAAPKTTADRVAAAVLREQVAPTSGPVRAHPRAARRRRLVRALLAGLAPGVVLAVLGLTTTTVLLHLAWISVVVLLPVTLALGMDAYRNLGHALNGAYLLARSGAVRRNTVALRRSGIIGWTVRQSVFQRRAGLVTVTAVTAAGSGGYRVADVGESDGIDLAATATPGLLDQFVERVPG